jgi:hypothetical protein
MTTSDHRHPGAKKRPATPALACGTCADARCQYARDKLRDCKKFPLIVGPPFIHAANPAMAPEALTRGIYDIFDFSTIGMDLLATRQPKAQPIFVLAQRKLNPGFKLI